MGTRFELVLVDACGSGSGRALRAAGEAALEVIRECEERWSAFRSDSLVARIRRGPQPVRVDRETYRLLEASLALWHRTGGRFDVSLGGAMDTLGFRGRLASADRVAPCVEPPLGLDADRQTVSVRPGSLLDLGGVAKGCALDLAALELREAGIECALLHGGTSSVVALGAPPAETDSGAPGWRVAVPDPLGSAPELIATLADTSLSVSAPHGRTAPAQGSPESARGHVIDPRTGRTAELGRLACVVAPSGLEADGLATALVIEAADGENAALLSPPSGSHPGQGLIACALATGPRDQRRWSFRGAHASHFETRIPQTT